MAVKQGRTKAPRKHKESLSVNRGSKRQRPSEILLITMGKGMAHKSKNRGGR